MKANVAYLQHLLGYLPLKSGQQHKVLHMFVTLFPRPD